MVQDRIDQLELDSLTNEDLEALKSVIEERKAARIAQQQRELKLQEEARLQTKLRFERRVNQHKAEEQTRLRVFEPLMKELNPTLPEQFQLQLHTNQEEITERHRYYPGLDDLPAELQRETTTLPRTSLVIKHPEDQEIMIWIAQYEANKITIYDRIFDRSRPMVNREKIRSSIVERINDMLAYGINITNLRAAKQLAHDWVVSQYPKAAVWLDTYDSKIRITFLNGAVMFYDIKLRKQLQEMYGVTLWVYNPTWFQLVRTAVNLPVQLNTPDGIGFAPGEQRMIDAISSWNLAEEEDEDVDAMIKSRDLDAGWNE